MLEKLLNDIKRMLPGQSQEIGDAAEDLLEDAASFAEDSEEDQKKKRTSMIIRVVVILGLAYFAVDEFFLHPEGDVETKTVAVVPAKKNKVKAAAPVTETATETLPVQTPTDEPANTAQGNAIATEMAAATEELTMAESSQAPPVENIVIMPKDEVVPETTTSTTSSPPPVVEQKIDELVKTIDETPPPVAPTPSVAESTLNPTSSPNVEEVNIPSQDSASSMASKIVEEATETLPPTYDHLGRGLVYNCKDKYWACLDKPAYITCNKNMKWNKSKGNPAECVVQDIYNTDEDCAKIQKYNVSTSLPTNFCQN